MKANEFVKKFGWEYSKHILNEDSVFLVDLDYTHLKHLIESYELVESIGGLDKAKLKVKLNKAAMLETSKQLKQAISDMENCL